MERKIFLTLLSLFLPMIANADTNSGTGFVGNGYYRIRNAASQRYIYFTDNKDYYDMSIDDEDLQSIKLWTGAERAAASPASVIFIEDINGNTFDLMAQGTGIHQLTNYYVTVTPKEENTYEFSTSKAGVTKYLSDNELILSEEEGIMGTGGTSTFRRWIVDKITPDHATNYVGIKPTIHVDGKHYAPYYAAFPFKAVSPNMHIYYARKIRSVEGVTELVLKEIEGDIPESMPVFIECPSENPTDNRIEPLTSKPAQISGNLLDGTFFCNGSRPRASVDAYRLFDETTMRIFTVKDGRLIVTNNMEDLYIGDPEEIDDPELNRLVRTRVWNPTNPTSPRKVVGYCIPANTSYLTADANTPAEFGVRFESGMLTEDKLEVDGIFYSLNSEEKVAEVICSPYGDKYEGDIVIPSSITYNSETYRVTSIGNKAFYECRSLKSVTISNNVTNIGNSAFMFCRGLTSVIIPNSVTCIGEEAFNHCWLTSVTIGSGIKSIGASAFAFNNLSSIDIPQSITDIGYNAFYYNRYLTSIKVEEGNTVYDSREDCNAIIETTTNTLTVGCRNTIIPNSVTSIGDLAFYGHKYGFTSITIPGSVTHIGSCAFGHCDALTDVYCYAEEVPYTNNDAFDYTPISLATLYVPEGSIDLYKTTSPWSGFGSIVPLTTTGVEINETNFPDKTFRDWLLSQEYGIDGVLTDTEIANTTYINVGYCGIKSLRGIEYFTALTELDCYRNQLTELDLSKNEGLTYLACDYNNLTSLDVSKNTKLNTLNISNNNLAGDIGQFWEQLTAGQESPITTLNISDNRLSGNIGLFANCFDKLKSLNASGNSLEDAYPMISPMVTFLDIGKQTISRVVYLHLGTLTTDNIKTIIPTILLYDHVNRTYSPNISMLCATPDGGWEMSIVYQDGHLSMPYVSEQNTFYGKSGDILNVAVLNPDGTPEGSTFRVSLSFDDGDGNFDGQVNVLDLQTSLNYMFHDYNNKPFNFTASNLYRDEVINVQDVVLMVDKLLDAGHPNNIKMNGPVRVREEALDVADACLYWRGNELVLNTSTGVAAADICLSGDASITWSLQQMGFTVKEKKDAKGTHAVIYSLSDAEIPVGETVIAHRNGGNAEPVSAMLSDRQAEPVSVSLTASEATAIAKLTAVNGDWSIFRTDGTIVAQGTGSEQLASARKHLATGVYILQRENNNIQKFIIK